MIFSSIFFIFVFLPITLILYYLVPFKLKNFVLLVVSLIFYAWGEPVYVFLMILNIVINYISGLEIETYRRQGKMRQAKWAFIVTLVVNLLVLGFYKYYGFFISNLNVILPIKIPYHELALPIGISFYTFQTLSYVIDVYKGSLAAQRNIITFGSYVTMFPQLIAGPIVRYSDVEKQLSKREICWSKFSEGVAYFLTGLGKKVLIANNMGLVCDAILAMNAPDTSALTAWIGAFAYTMQIYFDFGGYSDMAIGLGKMLGFDFIKNFDYPYISKSITEFWRRWHMSLSSWFKEYVYIPLGGNRVSTPKAIRNLMIVWCLTGLWHGAAWNFIAWGLYYGILLIFEKYIFKNILDKLPGALQHVYAMVLVMIGWVLFAAPSLPRAISFIGSMFGAGAGVVDSLGFYYLKTTFILAIIAILCSTPKLYKTFMAYVYTRKNFGAILYVGVYVLIFAVSVAYLVNATYNPFLYFRF